MAREEILQMTSIENSPEIELSGEKLIDLVSQPIFANQITTIQDAKIVSRDLAGRPVAIMKAIYKTSKHLDLFFSLNGYSNPLTVKEGDVLVIPDLISITANLRRNDKINVSIQELEKRLSGVDKSRLKFLEADTLKQPNQNSDRKQFTKKPNRVISLGKGDNEVDAVLEIRNRVINKIKTNK